MWDELWLGKECAARDLVAAVARALDVPESDIAVIDGIANDATASASIVVYRSRGAGAFPTRVQLTGSAPDDRRAFCARLASELDTTLLGNDGTVTPNTFMQYTPGGAERVEVDAAKLEDNTIEILGPYEPRPDDDSHPTRPIRRYPEPASHRSTRGGQVAYIVNDYLVEGLPRPPLLPWSEAVTEVYHSLTRLLGTLAYREGSADEIADVKRWSDQLRAEWSDLERAGWFVVEVLECASIVLAEPWHPDKPAMALPKQP